MSGMFKKGDIVLHKLNQERMIVLQKNGDYYLCKYWCTKQEKYSTTVCIEEELIL